MKKSAGMGGKGLQYEQEYLLHLVSCGVMNRRPSTPAQPVDWGTLMETAGEHTVTLLVAAAVRQNPAIVIPPEVGDKPQRQLLSSAKRNKVRSAKIVALLQKMEQKGLRALVLKGMSFGRLYAHPEYREAIDTDLLVDPKQEKAVLDFFRKEGFSVVGRSRNEHHSRCYRRDLGTFEVHIQLWQDEFDKIIFHSLLDTKALWQNARKAKTDVGTIRTMSDFDNLVFSTMHFLKHFVFTGVTIRKIVDIARLYQHVRQRVDMDKYWALLRELDFEKTMHAFYGIAQHYLYMYEGEFAADAPLMELLLEDVFSGGYNGRLQKEERLAEWEVLLHEKTGRKYGKVGAVLYRFRRKFRERFYLLFPNRAQLEKGYPKLKKYGILYLPCVAHRLFTRGFRRLKNDKAGTPTTGTQRLDLMRELKIL